MTTRGVVPLRVKPQMRSRSYQTPAHLSERCALSIIGVLAAFLMLVHGMLTVETLPPAVLHEQTLVYWITAALGIWVPAMCLFVSIVGVVIPGWASMFGLIFSPILSVGGYLLYTYLPLESLLRQLVLGS